MFPDNMTPQELSDYKNNVLDSLNDGVHGQWISVGEFDKRSKTKPICSYSPPRGDNRNLFCGTEFVTGNCRVNWRCEEHIGKEGRGEIIMSQNLILKDSDKHSPNLHEKKHFCTYILPDDILCETQVERAGDYCDFHLEVETKSGISNPKYRCPYIGSDGKVCNLIILKREVFCNSHLVSDKKTAFRPKKTATMVLPKRKEVEESSWYNLEDFKKLDYTNLCTYSPHRGRNKDKICGKKTTNGNKHCVIHIDVKGKKHTIVPELKVETPKLPVINVARWSSVTDYLSCVINGEMKLCAYSPHRGRNMDKICCNEIELRQGYIPPIWRLRCRNCWGKRGASQNLILFASLMLLRGEKIPTTVYPSQEVKIHTEEEIPEENPVAKDVGEIYLVHNESIYNILGMGWRLFTMNGIVYMAKLGDKITVYGRYKGITNLMTVFTREMIVNLSELTKKEENTFLNGGMLISYPQEVY